MTSIAIWLGCGVGAFCLVLWLRVKHLKREAKRERLKAELYAHREKHNTQIKKVERERQQNQPKRVKERVNNEIETDDFSDFYDD